MENSHDIDLHPNESSVQDYSKFNIYKTSNPVNETFSKYQEYYAKKVRCKQFQICYSSFSYQSNSNVKY